MPASASNGTGAWRSSGATPTITTVSTRPRFWRWGGSMAPATPSFRPGRGGAWLRYSRTPWPRCTGWTRNPRPTSLRPAGNEAGARSAFVALLAVGLYATLCATALRTTSATFHEGVYISAGDNHPPQDAQGADDREHHQPHPVLPVARCVAR